MIGRTECDARLQRRGIPSGNEGRKYGLVAPRRAGSAQRALNCDPPFDQIFFIEQDRSNVTTLRDLIKESDHRAATVERGDANEVLRKLCQPTWWRKRRGVIFLDPFGMNVDWSTLQMIAATEALDVWFLFPLSGMIRNLPRLASRLDAGKRAAVTRVLGTDKWFEEFYKVPAVPARTLFGMPSPPPVARRIASVNDIEAYVRKRLNTVFSHVEPPKRLKAPRNKSLFSLFFAVSNPSSGAIKLAQKAASQILKKG